MDTELNFNFTVEELSLNKELNVLLFNEKNSPLEKKIKEIFDKKFVSKGNIDYHYPHVHIQKFFFEKGSGMFKSINIFHIESHLIENFSLFDKFLESFSINHNFAMASMESRFSDDELFDDISSILAHLDSVGVKIVETALFSEIPDESENGRLDHSNQKGNWNFFFDKLKKKNFRGSLREIESATVQEFLETVILGKFLIFVKKSTEKNMEFIQKNNSLIRIPNPTLKHKKRLQKIFHISKIKKNSFKKKREIQQYIQQITLEKRSPNKQKTILNPEIFDDEENPLDSALFPNSLISISKDVHKYLKENNLVNIKDLNELIYKKISSIEKLSEKNIQRRVYDAINVMNAIGLLKKDRSMLSYEGKLKIEEFPCVETSQEKLIEEINRKKTEMKEKMNELLGIYTKYFLLEKLTYKNREDQFRKITEDKIFYPFILIKQDSTANFQIKQDDLNTRLCILSDKKLELINADYICKVLLKNDVRKLDFFIKKNMNENVYEMIKQNGLIENFFYPVDANIDSTGLNDIDDEKNFIHQSNIIKIVEKNFEDFDEDDAQSDDCDYNIDSKFPIDHKDFNFNKIAIEVSNCFNYNSKSHISNNENYDGFSTNTNSRKKEKFLKSSSPNFYSNLNKNYSSEEHSYLVNKEFSIQDECDNINYCEDKPSLHLMMDNSNIYMERLYVQKK